MVPYLLQTQYGFSDRCPGVLSAKPGTLHVFSCAFAWHLNHCSLTEFQYKAPLSFFIHRQHCGKPIFAAETASVPSSIAGHLDTGWTVFCFYFLCGFVHGHCCSCLVDLLLVVSPTFAKHGRRHIHITKKSFGSSVMFPNGKYGEWELSVGFINLSRCL